MRCLVLLACLAASPAAAEIELSFYTGVQGATDSSISGDDPTALGDFDFDLSWDGESFSFPPYYGIRATWWRDDANGFALELNHTKVTGDEDTLDDEGFDRLEFTDGLNFLTANYIRRFGQPGARFRPYLGGGIGAAIPHVDVETAGSRTFEYQLAGPAAQVFAGVSHRLTDRWSIFGEAKIGYASIDADLDDGGSLETEVTTYGAAFGVSYSF